MVQYKNFQFGKLKGFKKGMIVVCIGGFDMSFVCGSEECIQQGVMMVSG